MKKSILIFAFSLITALSFGQWLLQIQKAGIPGGTFINVSFTQTYSPDSIIYTAIGNSAANTIHNLDDLNSSYYYKMNQTGSQWYYIFKSTNFDNYSPENRIFYVDTIITYYTGGGEPSTTPVNMKIDLNNAINYLSTPIVDINSVSIYPNPVTDYLNISINGTENIILTGLNGQIIFNDIIYTEGKIDLLNQPNGIYILQIGNQFHKIVKQ
ncbi:T9SS type A sorting domain-containing protein [Crocinitomicaceae bacterium CZZ-1]|uniref:T9SS type A sorting domain-containing protein n=1 Tax=Taishania pollutisoli TaxID=2766479 RepID=A0A8J6U1F2_9FLAO|nr:T9SS type A sorting domain-containing protein [Taishania pollutisoli]MBC9813913.1 T9SS type A sorting domain-containing protein [Taishania pollutisoli]